MAWSQFVQFEYGGKTFFPRDVPGDGNCFFHCAAISPILPLNDASLLRRALVNFAIGSGRAVAEKLYELLRSPALAQPLSFIDVINTIGRPGKYAENFEMVLLSLVFNIGVVSYSNYTTGIDTFSSSAFLDVHMPEQKISSELCMYVYNHQFLQPLNPVPPAFWIRLNHFALLIPTATIARASVSSVVISSGALAPGGETIVEAPKSSTLEHSKAKQTSILDWFQKPTSVASKRKGVSFLKGRNPKKQNKPMPVQKLAEHHKKLSITMRWADMTGVNHVAAAAMDKACEVERRRRQELAERQANCEDSDVIHHLLSDMLDQVSIQYDDMENRSISAATRLPTGRPKELTWQMRSRYIAFHLHSDLGASNFAIFSYTFGGIVRSETLRNWLRKETIYKWLDPVRTMTKDNIMSIVPKEKMFLFSKGDRNKKISEKVLTKFACTADAVAKQGKQQRLVFNTGNEQNITSSTITC
jgi:hypothetical protein